jgi:hypothetical protein
MTETSGHQCAAPGCTRRPVAGYLCELHRSKLGQTLTDLRGDLGADTGPAISGWRIGAGSGGTLASERDPVNLRMLDAQKQAPPVLAAWAHWVCEQRDLSRSGWPEGDRKLLAANLDWLVAQPQVVDLWVQIRALWASLRGHLPVRRCTCGGPVWSDRGGGWCSWCATPWAGAALLALARPEAA